MKAKTTNKFINRVYDLVFRAGYCELQHIFYTESPRFYNCGVYGWNYDVYTDYTKNGDSVAITTGYRNMTGERIAFDIIEKYDSIAREIINSRDSWQEKETKLNKNRAEFIAAITA